MLNILFQLTAAFIGTVSFSILFSTPNKYLPQCGLIGAMGWGVYLLTLHLAGSSVAAIFAASAILTICSRYLARFYKVTTTLFLISGIFTLVPGAGIYYTARAGSDSFLLRHAQFKNSPRHRTWYRRCLFFTAKAFWMEKTKLK